MKHNHGEAFMLMKYATKDGCYWEMIWNSRDGVTPFIIHSEDGRELQHVEWKNDQYAPDWTPEIGHRIFVDATLEHCKEDGRRWAKRYWNDPQFRAMYPNQTQEQVAQDYAEREFSQHGEPPPHVLIVNAGVLEWLKMHRKDRASVNK